MASITRRLSSLLILTIIVTPATVLNAQTPEAKSKPSSSITGRVTVGDKPVPGISVVVSNQNSSNPAGQATTDAEGNYRINGLPAGQLTVMPVTPVYVTPGNPGFGFGQGRIVNLAANEIVDGVDFKLIRGGVITGRITDPDGRPVIEERIALMTVDEKGAPARQLYSQPSNFMMYLTDDRGVYRIYGLSPGRYRVSVGASMGSGMRASGYFQETFYPDVTDAARAQSVEVVAGGEARNIDIKLGRRLQTYAVSGRIIDADTGKPVPNVNYSFGMIRQNQGQSYVGGAFGMGTPTNSLGEFRSEGVSPGRFVFLIESRTFNLNAPAPKVYSEPVPFEVIDGDVTDLEIKARPGLSISGVIVPDGITDQNILARLSRLMVIANVEPAQNSLRVSQGGSNGKVNPDRSFLIEGLQPGKVWMNVEGFAGPDLQGFKMTRIEHNGVAQGPTTDLPAGQNLAGVAIFVAYGSGVISGQVKVEGGTLPNDAAIFVVAQRQGDTNPNRINARVDSRGRFVIRAIPAGTYELLLQVASFGQTALPSGFQRQHKQSVIVNDGAETEVVFTIDLTRKEGP